MKNDPRLFAVAVEVVTRVVTRTTIKVEAADEFAAARDVKHNWHIYPWERLEPDVETRVVERVDVRAVRLFQKVTT